MGCLQVDSEFRNLTQVLALFLGYAGTSTDDGPDLVDAILKWLFVPAGSTDKAVRERACILIGELLASSSEAAISLWEDAIGALLQRATDSISAVRVAALDAVAAGCLSPPGTAVCSQLLVHASSATHLYVIYPYIPEGFNEVSLCLCSFPRVHVSAVKSNSAS